MFLLRSGPRISRFTRLACAGEVDRRLAGRVAAADQRHLGAGAEPRLHRRGPVPDAAALEPLDVRRAPAGGSARRWRSPPCAR